MAPERKALLQIHFCVLLWGFTAILGKLISLPALELVCPHLRTGAVILADNTDQFRRAYRHFFEFVNDPANGLKTLTLPFQGGLEMVVKV